MNIILPSFEILTEIDYSKMLKNIESIGRISYKSEDKISENTAESFVKMLIARKHLSVLEHENISVKIICDRGVSHELVRHRLASYCQESTRYCNYSKGKFGSVLTFIKPCFWEDNSEEYKCWVSHCYYTESRYMRLIKMGASPQEARSILPNSLKTEIVATMNLRQWMHFFDLRTASSAHPQMREIAIPLLQKFTTLMPAFFQNDKGEDDV